VVGEIGICCSIPLGAFYTIGFLLNRHTKKNTNSTQVDVVEKQSSEFISTLSSTASQSTLLNILLWECVAMLEDLLDKNQHQIKLLKDSVQLKNQQIADLETQIQQIQSQKRQVIALGIRDLLH